MMHVEAPHKQETNSPHSIPVTNPLTGEIMGSVPIQTRDEVFTTVAKARAAQPAWAALPVKTRNQYLRRWCDLLLEHRDEVIAIIRRETGKSESSAFSEIPVIDLAVNYNARLAERLLKPQRRKPTIPFLHQAKVIYKPRGVIGFITPWNYPLNNAFIDLIAALIGGNTAILKPSEITPFTSEYVLQLMAEAGVPKDVVIRVTGNGSTGEAIIDAVDYVSFTGSTATGRKVAVRCAERLIGCSLELGGKDAAIVLDDADVDVAVAGIIRGTYENSGQICVALERTYVEKGIYPAFVQGVIERVNQMRISAEAGLNVDMGSLTNQRELERTEAFIADAVSKGAKVVAGGQRRPDLGPLFFEPTVLVDVDHTMQVMNEETFGPIMPILKVDDAQEALRLANSSPYGLSGAIFTKNIAQGEALASQMECGDVSINRPQFAFATPTVPIGGVKNSGLGRRNGEEGFLRFLSPQSIMADRMWVKQTAITHADPLTLRIYFLLRKIRKVIPWV